MSLLPLIEISKSEPAILEGWLVGILGYNINGD